MRKYAVSLIPYHMSRPYVCQRSHSIVHVIEDGFNFLLAQFSEKRLTNGGDTYFNLIGAEVRRDNLGECLDGGLQCLLRVPLAIVLLECAL